MTDINTYLKIRRYVIFMADLRFYAYVYGTSLILAVIASLIFGREGFKVVLMFWGAMQWVTDIVFFAGTAAYHDTDQIISIHDALTFVLPSLIAAAWFGMEKITGINAHLKRNGLIPE